MRKSIPNSDLEEVGKKFVRQTLNCSDDNQLAAMRPLGRDARHLCMGLRAALVCALAALVSSTQAAGFFGSKKSSTGDDPFLAAHAEKGKELRATKGAHAPVAEGSCSKCHASPKEPTKMVLEGKELCLSCHKERAADLAKATVHPPFKDMDCSTCHSPHGSENRALLNAPANQMCTTCHALDDEDIKKSHHGISIMEMECTSCHSPHASANPKLILEGKQHVPFKSRSCELCHDKPGKDGKAALKDTPEKTCFACHSDFRKLSEKSVIHPPFAAGSCIDCHEPHIRRIPGQLKKVPQELCLTCHDAGLKDSHPAAGHPTSKKGVMDPRRKDHPFDCVSCHEPHAGTFPSLTRYEPRTLCEGCHQK